MDHCAVDYEKGKKKWLSNFPDEAYPQSHLEFWTNLEPMSGFLDSLKKLEEIFDVYLLTSPSMRNRISWTGKAIWVFNNLGPTYLTKLIQSFDKSQFVGAFLIDDGTKNGQTLYNGEHIQFGKDETFSSWPKLVDYILKSYAQRDILSEVPNHYLNEMEDLFYDSSFSDYHQKNFKEGVAWALRKMKESNPPIN
jgi:hypothetical protein